MSQTVDDSVGDMAVRRGPNAVVRFVERWALVALGVLVWQWVTTVADNRYFPTPLAIVRAAGRLWLSGPPSRLGLTGAVVHDLLPPLGLVAAGWGAAVVVGVAAGLAAGRSPIPVRLPRAVPLALLAAVFLALVHVSAPLRIAAIAVGAGWPVLVDTAAGARAVDPTMVQVAAVYRVPWYVKLFVVIVPAAAAKIITGLRVGLWIAFGLVIIAELAGGTTGIGAHDLPGLWAWTVLVGVIGRLAVGFLAAVERRVLPCE